MSDTPGKAAELHGLEPARAQQLRELLRPGEAAHARGQVRVRVSARQEAAEQRDDAVEPELVEELQRAARRRDLEDPQPAAGPEHTAQLPDRSFEVLDVPDPEAHDRRVEARVLERKLEHVRLHPFELGRLSPGPLEHPLGEVDPDDVARAGVASGDGEIARAAAGVEHVVSGPHGLSDGRPAPALVEAGGHDAVHRVVDRGDPVEHAPDAFRRQPAALHRHVCPQRGVSACSSPSRSRARATMKSTRFSTVSAPW